ncbi:hypothetical protein [Nocardiopsis oceani]
MSRTLVFVLLAVAGVLAVVGVLLEERSLPMWAMAAAAGLLAVVGILTKKPLERVQERFDPLRRGNAHRKHLVHGKPLRVREAVPDGPGNLGVTYARYRDPADVHSDRIPEYVPRPALERQVREQLEAHGIVVVTGGSATGKSRLAYEVVRDLYPTRFLQRPVVPASGAEGVRGLVEEGLLPRHTVFWLDGVEDHLARGLRAEDVTALMPKGSGNVVVATMRVNPRGAAAGGDRGESAQHVFLRRFAGNEVRVPRGNDGYAGPRSEDPRVREAFAQDRSSVTEYLAQGPVAHQEWQRMLSSNDSHRAGAVVSAAVQARRAGRHSPLPVELLRTLHEEYVDTSEGRGAGRQTFEEALAQASAAIDGANGCLVRSDRSPGAYYAFDYLADRAQAEDDRPVGERFLEVLIEAAEGPELVALGGAALRSGSVGSAADLVLAATDRRLSEAPEDGPALALRGRALLVGVDGADPEEPDTEVIWNGQVSEAMNFLLRAAEGGDLGVCLLVGTLFYRTARFEEAVGFLELVEAPDARTLTRLGKGLRELGRFEEALTRFAEAKQDGWIEARLQYADTLAPAGRPDLALEEYDTIIAWAAQHAELRDVRLTMLNNKGVTLFKQGRVAEGIALGEEGAARGEAYAFNLLRSYFEGAGNHRMAALWTERAADAGLLWALRQTGRLSSEEAFASIEHWQSRVQEGGVDPDSKRELELISLMGRAEETRRDLAEFERVTEEQARAERVLDPFLQEISAKVLNATEGEAEGREPGDQSEEQDAPEEGLGRFLRQPPFFRELLVRLHTGSGSPGQPEADQAGPSDELGPPPEPSVEERLAELRDQGRYRDVIGLLTPLVVKGRTDVVEPLVEALTAVGVEDGLVLVRAAVPVGYNILRLVDVLADAGRDDLSERLLVAEVDGGRQWAVRELGDLYEAQARFAELREHYRYQVHLGSHVAAAELAKHLVREYDHTEPPGDLAWPLASFARAGGEMSASLVLGIYSHLSGSPGEEDSSEREMRLRMETAESGEGHVYLLLADESVAEGRFDQAEEVFYRGVSHPAFRYRAGAYLRFGATLVEAGQRERAAAVLARVPDESLSDEERARLTELRERCGVPRPAPEREGRR